MLFGWDFDTWSQIGAVWRFYKDGSCLFFKYGFVNQVVCDSIDSKTGY